MSGKSPLIRQHDVTKILRGAAAAGVSLHIVVKGNEVHFVPGPPRTATADAPEGDYWLSKLDQDPREAAFQDWKRNHDRAKRREPTPEEHEASRTAHFEAWHGHVSGTPLNTRERLALTEGFARRGRMVRYEEVKGAGINTIDRLEVRGFVRQHVKGNRILGWELTPEGVAAYEALTPEQREPSVFTTETLAAHWSCSRHHVTNLINRGELGHTKLGRLIRITPEHVRQYEESHKVGGNKPGT